MNSDRYYLKVAMEEARIAFQDRTYPVGAVIVSPDDEIISQEHNHVYSKGDFTSHAEIEAIRAASDKLMAEQNYQKCTLYTTLEPCFMCCGAILHARIARVVWIKNDEIHGALQYVSENRQIFNELYAGRFEKLKIHPADEEDLKHIMDGWMSSWENVKGDVLVDRMCVGKK